MNVSFCFAVLQLFLGLFLDSSVVALLDFEELANIQYAIDILDKPLLLDDINGKEGIVLSSTFGQLYQCHYEAVVGSDSRSLEEENVAKADVVDLLKPMEMAPCLVQSTGWWTYELCYKKDIKQYHIEEGKITGNIIYLGRYASEFNWNDIGLKSRPEYIGRYHSQEYANGSVCDLTGELRSTSVRFKCQNGVTDEIESVEEPTTCNYVITVHTNRICQHPELRLVSQKKSVPIICQPLLTDEEYALYIKFHTKESPQKLSSEAESENERETTDEQPGTSVARKESIFIMAEAPGDAVSNGDELKRVLVGKIVRKLKDSLDNDQEVEEGIQDKNHLLNQDDETTDEQQTTQEEDRTNEDGDPDPVTNHLREQDDSQPFKLPTDGSSELQETLEGILSAVNSELKTLTGKNDEEDVEDEDKDKSQSKKETRNKLVAHESNSGEQDPSTDKQHEVEKASVAEKATNTANMEGSFIKWQGHGNQVQQITIDSGMKVQVHQRSKDDENDKEKASEANENAKTKSSPPSRKVEVRIINAAYYNKDGKPVSVYADDPNPSIEHMVIALLQRNDDEVAEFERQKRIEENYRFKWSDQRKKKGDNTVDD